jgi:hypothetical protein
VVVLTGSVPRHGRHDLRRHLSHMRENNIRRGLRRTIGHRFLVGELLNPRLYRQAFSRGLRQYGSRLFVGQFDREDHGDSSVFSLTRSCLRCRSSLRNSSIIRSTSSSSSSLIPSFPRLLLRFGEQAGRDAGVQIFFHSFRASFHSTGTGNPARSDTRPLLTCPPVLPHQPSISGPVRIPRNHTQIIMESMVGRPLFAGALLAPENACALAL